MVSSSSSKGRKYLKNLVHGIQIELSAYGSEVVVNTRFRDAFFYLLAEKWLIAKEVSGASTILQLLGFSAEVESKNIVSDLLSASPYTDLWPCGAPLQGEDLHALESLGWLYQYWNGPARDSVTWAISRVGQDGLNNESVTLATQIYTERYMAEYLVQQVLQNVDDKDLLTLSVIDPACGSGHILLSVCEYLGERLGDGVFDWVLSGKLQGVDIDGTAVSITRLVVLLYLVKSGVGSEELQPLSQVLAESIRSISAPLGTLCRASSKLKEGSYDVVMTNPPYIGRRKLHPDLREFLSEHYTTASGDLAFAFTVRCVELLKPGGHLALVSNDKWIRLRSYFGLRWSLSNTPGIFSHLTVQSLVELGSRAFHREANLHDGVGVALLHAINTPGESDRVFWYINLTEPKDFDQKAMLLAQNICEGTKIEHRAFSSPQISGVLLQAVMPHVGAEDHWTTLGKSGSVVVGIQTNEDRTFVAPQWMLPVDAPGWVVHQRGGGVQKWFGLNRWMLNLEGVRRSLRAPSKGPFPVEEWFEKEGWTYSWFASGTLALRKKEKGWSFGRAAASGVFVDDLRIIGFLNSSIGSTFATRLSGKVQLPEGVVRELPIPRELSAISPSIIQQLIDIQEVLVAQDPREATFSPMRIIPPLQRIALEKEYHDCTLRLEAAALAATEGEFRDMRPQGNQETSRDTRRATKEEIREVIERLATKNNIRPEQVVRKILDELRLFFSNPAETLIELFSSEERIQRVVYHPYLLERIHYAILNAVGHQWRADDRCTQGEYRSISIEELKNLSKEISHELVDKREIPPFIATELEVSCDEWLHKKLSVYHNTIFSGYPLLRFSESEVTHMFSR